MTLKINRVPDFLIDQVCTKFGQNPLKDVDSIVFTRMLRGKNFKYVQSFVDSIVFTKMLRTDGRTEGRTETLLYPLATSLARE